MLLVNDKMFSRIRRGSVKVVVMRVISRPDVHVFLTLQTSSQPALVKYHVGPTYDKGLSSQHILTKEDQHGEEKCNAIPDKWRS
jgi:hypothetical protein